MAGRYGLKVLLVFALLTVLTQVGGIIYLLYQPFSRWIQRQMGASWRGRVLRAATFCTLYLAVSAWLVPPLARRWGRVPLPWKAAAETPLKPRHLFYCLANRHYVRPALREAVIATARLIERQHPGARLSYLDGNFPFWDGFRLFPHLSHDDGEKLDLCFLYRKNNSSRLVCRTPSPFGYGAGEGPLSGEIDQPALCARQGYWQYSLLNKVTPRLHASLNFDEKANRELLLLLNRQPGIGKIFIEPHLKQRLGLQSIAKVRYHGCQAVRHDDHVHVQI